MVLYLKELKITDVLAVDFLDQPDKYGLVEACKQLFLLGALDADGKITPQGRQLAKIPVIGEGVERMTKAERERRLRIARNAVRIIQEGFRSWVGRFRKEKESWKVTSCSCLTYT